MIVRYPWNDALAESARPDTYLEAFPRRTDAHPARDAKTRNLAQRFQLERTRYTSTASYHAGMRSQSGAEYRFHVLGNLRSAKRHDESHLNR